MIVNILDIEYFTLIKKCMINLPFPGFVWITTLKLIQLSSKRPMHIKTHREREREKEEERKISTLSQL